MPKPVAKHSLSDIRKKVDQIDLQLVVLLAERTQMAIMAAKYKQNIKSIFDAKREKEILNGAIAKALELGVEPELVKEIFGTILKYSRIAVANEFKKINESNNTD